jgi:hypothetical protein
MNFRRYNEVHENHVFSAHAMCQCHNDFSTTMRVVEKVLLFSRSPQL